MGGLKSGTGDRLAETYPGVIDGELEGAEDSLCRAAAKDIRVAERRLRSSDFMVEVGSLVNIPASGSAASFRICVANSGGLQTPILGSGAQIRIPGRQCDPALNIGGET